MSADCSTGKSSCESKPLGFYLCGMKATITTRTGNTERKEDSKSVHGRAKDIVPSPSRRGI